MVTVALPVLNGEAHLEETLHAVRSQRAPGPVELLVSDSGSRDRSVEIVRSYGGRGIPVPRGEFSHGGARNLFMRGGGGSPGGVLTQDAGPGGRDRAPRALGGLRLGGGGAPPVRPHTAPP